MHLYSIRDNRLPDQGHAAAIRLYSPDSAAVPIGLSQFRGSRCQTRRVSSLPDEGPPPPMLGRDCLIGVLLLLLLSLCELALLHALHEIGEHSLGIPVTVRNGIREGIA